MPAHLAPARRFAAVLAGIAAPIALYMATLGAPVADAAPPTTQPLAPPTTQPVAPPTTLATTMQTVPLPTDGGTPVVTNAPPPTVVAGTVPALETEIVAEAPDRAPGDPVVSGPTVSLERYELSAGEAVIVSMTGFTSRSITVTVCGNEARRGSADCNMRGGKAREIEHERVTTQLRYIVSVPPTPCPCLMRVANSDQSEIGIAEFTLRDHPVVEPVDPEDPGPLVSATLVAEPHYGNMFGRAQASLGGAVDYLVTLRVTNLTTTRLTSLSATASALRGTDELADVPILDPDTLEAGQTWEHTVLVELPAPRWGSVEWNALVSGSGPAVAADTATANRPTALLVLAAVLVLDVIFLVVKRLRKRRGNRPVRNRVRPRRPSTDQTDVVDVEAIDREPELVG